MNSALLRIFLHSELGEYTVASSCYFTPLNESSEDRILRRHFACLSLCWAR